MLPLWATRRYTFSELFPVMNTGLALFPVLSLQSTRQSFETDMSTATPTLTPLILAPRRTRSSTGSRGTPPCSSSSKRPELLILICQPPEPAIGDDGWFSDEGRYRRFMTLLSSQSRRHRRRSGSTAGCCAALAEISQRIGDGRKGEFGRFSSPLSNLTSGCQR